MPNSDDREEILAKLFDEKLEEWKSTLKMYLKDKVKLSLEVIEKLPILPTGRRGLPLLLKGLSPWLSNLWMDSVLVTKHKAQPALIKMNLQRLKYASDIHSEAEFEKLLKKEFIIIESKATEIGKLVKAEEAAAAVGITSGLKASIAHTIERIFDRSQFTKVLNTTITIDEEAGIIAAHIFCMHLPH